MHASAGSSHCDTSESEGEALKEASIRRCHCCRRAVASAGSAEQLVHGDLGAPGATSVLAVPWAAQQAVHAERGVLPKLLLGDRQGVLQKLLLLGCH